VFETVLLPEARAARDALSHAERADVDRVLRLLELNPWADGVTRFTLVLGGVGMGVYDDERWEIVYRILDDRFIEVVGISRIGD
jgi:hypothetical protein